MLNFLNRAVLCRESSAQDAARIRAELQKAGIPFRQKTTTKGSAKPAVKMGTNGRTGSFASGYTPSSSITTGVPQSWADGGKSSSTYVIYVSKKDLSKAKELCEI
jgi:hypothetical protein